MRADIDIIGGFLPAAARIAFDIMVPPALFMMLPSLSRVMRKRVAASAWRRFLCRRWEFSCGAMLAEGAPRLDGVSNVPPIAHFPAASMLTAAR